MTHHIPHPVVLEPTLGQCEPRAHYCPRSANCATHLVSPVGRSRVDYTIGASNWTPEKCVGWRDVAQHRPAPAAPTPTAHETPEGLR